MPCAKMFVNYQVTGNRYNVEITVKALTLSTNSRSSRLVWISSYRYW